MPGKLGFGSTTLQADREFAGSTSVEGHPHAASPWEVRVCGGTAPRYGRAAWDPSASSLHPSFRDKVGWCSQAGACLLVLILLCCARPGAGQASKLGRKIPLSLALLHEVPFSLLAHCAVREADAESDSFSLNHYVSLCSDSHQHGK